MTMLDDAIAVLSVRIPVRARDLLKTAAVARGATVQHLVGILVERFLAEDGQRAPDLAAVLVALRRGAPKLRARGVRGLCVVGAVAQGRARPGSGVELLCAFEAGERMSLVSVASLRAELSALVGAPVELTEWDGAADGCGGDAVRAL